MLKNCTVLLVEDDTIALTYLQEALRGEVERLHVAHTGEDGLKIYKNYEPDIIITNINLPLMDGLTMSEKIRQINPRQIILMMTDSSNIDFFKRAIHIGIQGYIETPVIKCEELIEKLRNFAKIINEAKHTKTMEHNLKQKNHIIDKHLLVTIADTDGLIQEVSEKLLTITGYTKEELQGKNHKILGHNEHQNKSVKELWENIQNNTSWSGELENRKKNGDSFWVDAFIAPLFDPHGVKTGYIAIKRNITDEKRIKFLSITDPLTNLYNRKHFSTILQSEINKAKLLNHTIGLIILNIDYFKQYNDYYSYHKGDEALQNIGALLTKITGKRTDFAFRIAGEEFALITSSLDFASFKDYCNSISLQVKNLGIAHKKSSVADTLTVSIGAVLTGKNYGATNIDSIYKAADTLLGKAKKAGKNQVVVEGMGSVLSIVSSEIDELTKLPLRKQLSEIMRSSTEEMLLMVLNINFLGHIHHRYGGAIADAILIEKAKLYRHIINNNEATLFRLNTDEFAILVHKEEFFDTYILKIKYYILEHTKCDLSHITDEPILVSQVVGMAKGREGLLGKADIALKRANELNQSIYLYSEELKEEFIDQTSQFENIRVYKDALENNRIIPYFQPIVDAKTFEIIKYEALARIIDEKGAVLSPQHFLVATKDDRTSEYFARQLIQKIFNISSKNQHVGFTINLTYENIALASLLAYIKNRLDTFGGENITFEIIESEEIQDYIIVKSFIEMIKPYNCTIAIDDFGTGYSNMAQLIQLDPDFLKLDGSLIQNINHDVRAERIVKSILTYTKSSGSKTIAEFVSTKEIAQKASEMGIDLLQGYYFGKPETADFYKLKC